MGVSSLHAIQSGLLQGLPASTPVAIVQHASLPQQREALTTLGELQATMVREGLQSPSIIVVGDVVQGARAWQAPSAAAPCFVGRKNPVTCGLHCVS